MLTLLRNQVSEKKLQLFTSNLSKTKNDVKLNEHEISREKVFGKLQTETGNALYLFFQRFHVLVQE